MNLKGFGFRQLSVLDMLLSERHVGRAAERLNLSQPAISNTLAWLRDHFEDPLLVRRGGRLHLTPFAERLRDQVRSVLVDFRTVANLRPTFHPATAENRFRIVMSHYVSALFLGRLLAICAHEAPHVTIEIARIDGDENAFRRGEIDLLLLPRERLEADFPAEDLFTDRWVCAGWKGAWADCDAMTPDIFRKSRHLLPDQPQYVAFELSAMHVERDVAAVVPYGLLLATLRGTPWLTTMPNLLAKASADAEDIRIFELPFPVRSSIIAQQWQPDAQDDPANRWLRAKVRQALGAAGIRTADATSP